MSLPAATQNNIHPTAIIHPSAKLEEGVKVGPYAVIGEGVVLHANVEVGPHAIIEFAEIGEGSRIHASAFVGTAPQDLKYRNEPTRLILGPQCTVRECVTLNRGTSASGVTQIGARCLFMAYSHVAHDCIIGDDVIMANSVALAGHVEVGNAAVIGGLAAVHQFTRIGRLAMVGGGAMVSLDVPPFTMAAGDRAVLHGLNLLGLRRKGYTASDVSAIKTAFRELFKTDRPLKELIPEMKKQPLTDAVKEMLAFIEASPRGICRPNSRPGEDSE